MRVVRALAALALYVGLTVWLTWPLASSLGTHLVETDGVSRFDGRFVVWVLAYKTHALVTDPARLADANIYHPTARTLFYGQTAFGALPFFAPVFLATGNPVLAMNLTFLAAVALTAWGLHLATHWFTGSTLAGFLAAWALLMNHWTLWLTPRVPNHAVLSYLPLIVVAAAFPALGRPTPLWLAPLIALQCLIDPVYVAPGVLMPLGVLVLIRVLRPGRRAAGMRLAGILALAVLLMAPVYAGYATVWATEPHLRTQTLWTIAQLWVPLTMIGQMHPAALPSAALLVIALGTLCLTTHLRSGLSPTLRAGWLHASLWAGVGILISLPPALMLAERSIMLPHRHLPWVYEVVRVPIRLGVPSLIGACLLVGLGFAECARRLPNAARMPWLKPLCRGLLAAVFVAAMYVEYRDRLPAAGWMPPPYPVLEALRPDPELMQVIRDTPGPLLELPVGAVRQGPLHHTRAMFRSIFHWRPLLNGYGSYWPADFPARMDLVRQLPDAQALATLRRETGLTSIFIVWDEMPQSEQARWAAIAAGHGQRTDLRPVAWKKDGLLLAVGDGAPP